MRKKQLKELHDKAIAMEPVNDVIIEHALECLKKEDLSDKDRIEYVEMLETALDSRNKLESVKNGYKERKAEDTGYRIGLISSLTGMVLAEVGPKIIKAIFKK